MTESKVCTSCKLDLPLSKYKKRGATGRQSHTLHSMCNRCLYIRYTRTSSASRFEEINQYKLDKGCADCGYNLHSAALEFDHLPGTEKSFNIGEKVRSLKAERIWEEIAKCEVVCANCHAIRTVERRKLIEIDVLEVSA